MKITDNDIIDSILERTSTKAEKGLRHGISPGSETDRRFEKMESVISALETEKKARHIVQDRVADRVINRLADDSYNHIPSADVASVSRGRSLAPRAFAWGSLSVAAGALIFISYLSSQSPAIVESGIDRTSAESAIALQSTASVPAGNSSRLTSQTLQSDSIKEGFADVGSNIRLQSALLMAKVSVPEGGILEITHDKSSEPIRITQPMRLEFIGGNIRVNVL